MLYFWIQKEMDAGPLIEQNSASVDPDDSVKSFLERTN